MKKSTESKNIKLNNWWTREQEERKREIKKFRRREFRLRNEIDTKSLRNTVGRLTKEYKKMMKEEKLKSYQKFVVLRTIEK